MLAPEVIIVAASLAFAAIGFLIGHSRASAQARLDAQRTAEHERTALAASLASERAYFSDRTLADREMLLRVLDHTKAASVVEAAEAAAVRAAEAGNIATRDATLHASPEYRQEIGAGFAADVAAGRAAMRAAGKDPNKPADVLAWNASFGEGGLA